MTNVTVRPASPSEQTFALRILFSETAPDDPSERTQEILAAAERGELSLAELWLAEKDGRPAGAGFFAEQPGRVAFVWPPGVSSDAFAPAEIHEALLAAICRRLSERGIAIGQAILEPEDRDNRRILERNGFPHLTDLHYMLCPADAALPGNSSPALEIESFDPAENFARFARVLKRTYIETLDCPELDGLRTPEEALAAHQATGQFEPDRWQLIQSEGQDAGLLLVNLHPDRDLLEIVYLGVVPEARGQGLGQAIVQSAVALARSERRPIVLAVDSRNYIAQRIYRRWGFRDLTVQSVHVWQAGAKGPVSQFTDYAQPPAVGKRNS